MRIVLGGLAMLALASLPSVARADVGPIDPARKICMGLAEGAACTIDGKPGTCHGPHPSRMYCDPKQPPAQDPGSGAAPTPGSAGSSAPAAEPGTTESTPGHKRGCAVTDPAGAAPVLLAVAAVLAARRRRARSNG